MVFGAQQVHLPSAGSEGVLHHDLGSGAHTGGLFSFPTDQDLELVQPFWRKGPLIVENHLPLHWPDVGAGFSQHDSANPWVVAWKFTIVVLPIIGVLGTETMR
jgi:hypothetical protein